MELKLKSDFAILDVKAGRAKLIRAIERSLETRKPIKVTITGTIDGIWGEFDCVSQEFSVDVKTVKATA